MEFVICVYCQEEVLAKTFCCVCGAPLDLAEEKLEGTEVHSYLIGKKLGEGSSGRIYEAKHIATEKSVAFKVLHAKLSNEPKAIRRFRREAEAGIRLLHPNAVKLFEFGLEPALGLFLVMELIDGPTLLERLRDGGSFSPKQAIWIMLQICDVLKTAHQQNIFHRDLKPANVMLQPLPSGSEVVKICDFGTVKLELELGAFDTHVTIPGMLCGTPGYMAPEQCLGEEVDARTDIYALGILLFKMLTGKLPFENLTPMSLLVYTLEGELLSLLQANAALEHEPALERLEEVISRCVALDPEERFSDVQVLSEELCGVLSASTQMEWTSTEETFSFPMPLPCPPRAYPRAPVRLSEQELQVFREFACKAPLHEFKAQQNLYTKDEVPTHFYLIKEGELRLTSNKRWEIIVLDGFVKGDFIGVSAFFARSPHFFDVETVRDSKLYAIDRTHFSQWVAKNEALQELFRHFYHEFLLQELIRYSLFFDSIPPSQRALLVQEFEMLPVGPGQEILEEGTHNDAFYLVASGQIEVYWKDEKRSLPRAARFLRPGQFFGEIALLTQSLATASVRAVSNAVLLRLSGSSLNQLLKPYPKVAELMLRIAQRRLKENAHVDSNDEGTVGQFFL